MWEKSSHHFRPCECVVASYCQIPSCNEHQVAILLPIKSPISFLFLLSLFLCGIASPFKRSFTYLYVVMYVQGKLIDCQGHNFFVNLELIIQNSSDDCNRFTGLRISKGWQERSFDWFWSICHAGMHEESDNKTWKRIVGSIFEVERS